MKPDTKRKVVTIVTQSKLHLRYVTKLRKQASVAALLTNDKNFVLRKGERREGAEELGGSYWKVLLQ